MWPKAKPTGGVFSVWLGLSIWGTLLLLFGGLGCLANADAGKRVETAQGQDKPLQHVPQHSEFLMGKRKAVMNTPRKRSPGEFLKGKRGKNSQQDRNANSGAADKKWEFLMGKRAKSIQQDQSKVERKWEFLMGKRDKNSQQDNKDKKWEFLGKRLHEQGELLAGKRGESNQYNEQVAHKKWEFLMGRRATDNGGLLMGKRNKNSQRKRRGGSVSDGLIHNLLPYVQRLLEKRYPYFYGGKTMYDEKKGRKKKGQKKTDKVKSSDGVSVKKLGQASDVTSRRKRSVGAFGEKKFGYRPVAFGKKSRSSPPGWIEFIGKKDLLGIGETATAFDSEKGTMQATVQDSQEALKSYWQFLGKRGSPFPGEFEDAPPMDDFAVPEGGLYAGMGRKEIVGPTEMKRNLLQRQRFFGKSIRAAGKRAKPKLWLDVDASDVAGQAEMLDDPLKRVPGREAWEEKGVAPLFWDKRSGVEQKVWGNDFSGLRKRRESVARRDELQYDSWHFLGKKGDATGDLGKSAKKTTNGGKKEAKKRFHWRPRLFPVPKLPDRRSGTPQGEAKKDNGFLGAGNKAKYWRIVFGKRNNADALKREAAGAHIQGVHGKDKDGMRVVEGALGRDDIETMTNGNNVMQGVNAWIHVRKETLKEGMEQTKRDDNGMT